MAERTLELKGKKVIVVGLGRSGLAAAGLCLDQGALVTGTDSAPAEKLAPEAQGLAARGARIVAGGHAQATWGEADLVVVSPGVPSFAELDRAKARGIPVMGELELAFRFAEGELSAIGGTNGKSTTTELVAAMLTASGRKVFAGGNLGTPLSEAAASRYDELVVEVSSFQTERIDLFAPRVAALLNVTDDHLDRYPNFAAYAAAKGNMFVAQTADDVAVVPKGDKVVLREAQRGEARLLTFGPVKDADVAVLPDTIVDRLREVRYTRAEIKLQGAHNASNVAAAIACASERGATETAIRSVLATFEGLAHRTAYVGALAGVRYYDDSKGTNVGAAVAALCGLAEARAVLIAGGRDKLGDYGPLVRALAEKGRALVVLGEAADRIAEAARGVIETARAASMDEAVRLASQFARPGDAVLLSPACSSFDMFRDYKDRGDAFARAVTSLSEGEAPPFAGGER